MTQENTPDYFYRITTHIPATRFEDNMTLDQDFATGNIIQDKAEAAQQYHLMMGIFSATGQPPIEFEHVLYLVENTAGGEYLHPVTGEPDEIKASLEIEAEVLAMNRAFSELVPATENKNTRTKYWLN